MKVNHIAIIGINGFGRNHLLEALQMEEDQLLKLTAVSDIRFTAEDQRLLEAKGIAMYTDYRKMLTEETDLDLVIVSTPINFHCSMGVAVMEAGYHLLLEKPAAAVIQEVDHLIQAAKETEKICAINFLKISDQAYKLVQKTLEDGTLGEVHSIVGIGLWKRLDDYYSRTPWAGKLKWNGEHVLDGTLNNPLAHLLYNMLNLARIPCLNLQNDATIMDVQAELYHARDIEGEDTACTRIRLENGIAMYFYATLCNQEQLTPRILIEGSLGTMEWDYTDKLTIKVEDSIQTFDCSHPEPLIRRNINNLMRVMAGEEEPLVCSLASTRDFTLAVNGAFESSIQIHPIVSPFVSQVPEEESVAVYIEKIDQVILAAAKEKKLFSEMDVAWAIQTKPFNLSHYTKFLL